MSTGVRRYLARHAAIMTSGRRQTKGVTKMTIQVTP